MKDRCKDWPFSLDRDGYGVLKINGKMKKAHRVAKEIQLNRKLSSKELVMHLCDNPKCINAEHLKIGSIAENNLYAKGKRQTQADLALPGWKNIYGSGEG